MCSEVRCSLREVPPCLVRLSSCIHPEQRELKRIRFFPIFLIFCFIFILLRSLFGQYHKGSKNNHYTPLLLCTRFHSIFLYLSRYFISNFVFTRCLYSLGFIISMPTLKDFISVDGK